MLGALGEAQRTAHWLLAAHEQAADAQSLQSLQSLRAPAPPPPCTAHAEQQPDGGGGASGFSDAAPAPAPPPELAAPARASKETLTRFVAAVKVLYMSLARSLTQRPRREDPGTPPSADARAAAAALMRVLLAALRWRGPYSPCGDTGPAGVEATAAGYTKRVVDELNGAVFDWRRKSCNALLLNQFYAQRGVQALAEALAACAPRLYTLAVAAEKVSLAAGFADAKGKEAPLGTIDETSSLATAAAAGQDTEAASDTVVRIAMAAAVTRILALMNNLANPSLLITHPPHVLAQLTLPPGDAALPPADQAALKPVPAEAEELLMEVQARLLGTLLPGRDGGRARGGAGACPCTSQCTTHVPKTYAFLYIPIRYRFISVIQTVR